MRAAAKLALALAALLVAAPAAQGFASVKKGGSPHDEATAVATELGWPAGAVEALQAAVRKADIDDFAPAEDDKDRIVATPVFHPSHHCDRVPPAGDRQAFQDTVAYVHQQRGIAANLSLLDPEAALRALGRALHAVQDCFSHTNAVDLPAHDRQRLLDALLRGGPTPAGLRLMGSDPAAHVIGLPAGDGFAHDLHNLDDHDGSPAAGLAMPDGRTRHEAALALARDATHAFLSDFQDTLDPQETAALLAVEARSERDAAPAAIPMPLAVVAGVLAVAAVLARRA